MGWYDNVQVQAPQGNLMPQAAALAMQGAGTTGNMANLVGKAMAESAVRDLMKKTPEKGVDPSKYIADVNSLLGYTSPEMQKSVEASNAALQTGYGRALEQDRFEKQIAQAESQFGRQLTQAEKLAIMQNDTAKEGHQLNYKVGMANAAAHAAQANLMAKQFNFTKGLKINEMMTQGYIPDKTDQSGWKYDPDTQRGIQGVIGNAFADFDAKYSADKLVKLGKEYADTTPSFFTRDSRVAEDYITRGSQAKALLGILLQSKPPQTAADARNAKSTIENWIQSPDKVSSESDYGKALKTLLSK